MGAALESSSHRYGQFNDISTAYEVLLGDGSIVEATPTTYPDLFYGLSGSYGSLGLLLAVEIQLVPAGKWVKLHYQVFQSLNSAITEMGLKSRQDPKADFIEALVFQQDQVVVITGEIIARHLSPPEEAKYLSLTPSWKHLFYQHVKKIADQKTEQIEYVSIQDYLFRHDRGAFWLGGYAYFRSVIGGFLLAKAGLPLEAIQKSKACCDLKCPGLIFRSLFGWMLESKRLYATLHAGSEAWLAKRFVIQDFYIPEAQTTAFTEKIFNEFPVAPIWLCPIKATSQPQFLAPHFNPQQELLFDVGVYGVPNCALGAEAITRRLELLTHEYQGRKMLYGHSYYSPEEFWTIYPKESYQNLRQKYHADHAWADLTNKVLSG